MAGRIGAVSWAEPVDELERRYRQATTVGARTRLQVLWLVRQGQSARAAAHPAGVGEHTAIRWLGWYRPGGLAAVLRRLPGHTSRGRANWLSRDQRSALLAEAATGRFLTAADAQAWIRAEFGVAYSRRGTYGALARLGIHSKVPRPQAERANPASQDAWKKGG